MKFCVLLIIDEEALERAFKIAFKASEIEAYSYDATDDYSYIIDDLKPQVILSNLKGQSLQNIINLLKGNTSLWVLSEAKATRAQEGAQRVQEGVGREILLPVNPIDLILQLKKDFGLQ